MESSTTTAKEIMTREILTVAPASTIEDVLKILVNNRVTGLPVVDKEGKMVGVVSEFDLLTQIAKSEKPTVEVFKQPIEFSKEVTTIVETAKLSEITPLFVTKKFRRLPVVDATGKLVGIITRRDMMRLYYYRAKLG
jgi:CBS domain-containing protein